jgi:hypothetical protein
MSMLAIMIFCDKCGISANDINAPDVSAMKHHSRSYIIKIELQNTIIRALVVAFSNISVIM